MKDNYLGIVTTLSLLITFVFGMSLIEDLTTSIIWLAGHVVLLFWVALNKKLWEDK